MTDEARQQLARLAETIAATAADELDCGAVLDRVAGYLEATENLDSLSEELRSVGHHLKICPDCAEEFDALVTLHRDQD